ncbi:hypothetical protein ACYSNW_16155 [Enterococcus sp. LJL99]
MGKILFSVVMLVLVIVGFVVWVRMSKKSENTIDTIIQFKNRFC